MRKNKSLLEVALSMDVKRRNHGTNVDNEEVELWKAFMERRITICQVAKALSCSAGSVQGRFCSFVRRAADKKIIGFLK